MSRTHNAIAFISGKGGSGKTVTSSSIGRFLAGVGYKVLLIDTDAATNGSTLLFLTEFNAAKREKPSSMGIFDCKDEELPSIVNVAKGLDFVPATCSMSQTDDVPVSDFSSVLGNLLSETREEYDYILVDAQAGGDAYARVSASQCGTAVIVSEFVPISAQGAERLKFLFSSVLITEQTWIYTTRSCRNLHRPYVKD